MPPLVTSAAIPLAIVNATGRRASCENMVCVASPAVFRNLGLLGHVFGVVAQGVRGLVTGCSSEGGCWDDAAAAEAALGPDVPLWNLRLWRRILSLDAHSLLGPPPNGLPAGVFWWLRLGVACVRLSLALPPQIASFVIAMRFEPSRRPQAKRCAHPAGPLHKTSRMP